MRLHISHGAGDGYGGFDWFVVKPLEGETETSVAGTPITHEMAVWSLLRAGRTVYELETGTGDGTTARRVMPGDPRFAHVIRDAKLAGEVVLDPGYDPPWPGAGGTEKIPDAPSAVIPGTDHMRGDGRNMELRSRDHHEDPKEPS